ncbi:MAG: hypothetical protein IJS45_06700 [Clostridia bacterium]|nr:hypothetical protein [Clostridia bacterium]
MNEVKTSLRRMAVYYLLLAVNVIPCASIIPDVFPTRNLSTLYLLALSVCLVLYYYHRVSPTGTLSAMMKAASWMALLLIFLRGVKYSAVSEVGFLARHTWYLYYVPMLLLPLFLFCISLLVSSKDSSHISKAWYPVLALTVVLIVLVLTNDLHQLVFGFKPDFENWDRDYSHGWMFYVVTFWQYALYFAAIIILVIKCRIVNSRKNAWIIMIPFLIGIVMNALLLTDKVPKINGSHLFEFPEALIFNAAAVLECCMQLGLIPTNNDYGKLFRSFSISAQITDQKGTPVYASHTAVPLTTEQFESPSGSRIGEHTVLHKMKIPGGYGFWQDDLTELDRLNGELTEAKEELAQEAELIRLRNELKEKQTKIEQRTFVYDTVAKRTQKQSQAISKLAEDARRSSDLSVKDDCRRRITLLGAYIKRYANLTLLSQESDETEAGELALSVSEVLRYLNYNGIPGEIINSADCTVASSAALAVFEAFETLIEAYYSRLQGVFVNLSSRDGVTFKLTFEGVAEPVPDGVEKLLSDAGVRVEAQCEDDVTYICFTLPKGGEQV